MAEDRPKPHYDLEDRTYRFAKRVRGFVRRLPRTICNIEDVKQLARSSNSVGSNYIEANEALSKKDFRVRIKICRKESKESAYHLRLLDTRGDEELERERNALIQEAMEFVKIFNAILRKSEE
jgi:four helix bundle protein